MSLGKLRCSYAEGMFAEDEGGGITEAGTLRDLRKLQGRSGLQWVPNKYKNPASCGGEVRIRSVLGRRDGDHSTTK